jgi:hypothetical protein
VPKLTKVFTINLTPKMAKKVIKRKSTTVFSRNAGTMTESQYFSKIRSMLRSGFRYWKPMQLALEAASRPSQSVNKRISGVTIYYFS